MNLKHVVVVITESRSVIVDTKLLAKDPSDYPKEVYEDLLNEQKARYDNHEFNFNKPYSSKVISSVTLLHHLPEPCDRPDIDLVKNLCGQGKCNGDCANCNEVSDKCNEYINDSEDFDDKEFMLTSAAQNIMDTLVEPPRAKKKLFKQLEKNRNNN